MLGPAEEHRHVRAEKQGLDQGTDLRFVASSSGQMKV